MAPHSNESTVQYSRRPRQYRYIRLKPKSCDEHHKQLYVFLELNVKTTYVFPSKLIYLQDEQ